MIHFSSWRHTVFLLTKLIKTLLWSMTWSLPAVIIHGTAGQTYCYSQKIRGMHSKPQAVYILEIISMYQQFRPFGHINNHPKRRPKVHPTAPNFLQKHWQKGNKLGTQPSALTSSANPNTVSDVCSCIWLNHNKLENTWNHDEYHHL